MAAEETHDETEPVEEPAQGETAREEERDWKAEYEKAVEQSRKWERRSKANASAAKELEKLKEQGMTDAERAEKAEAELAAYKAREEHREWEASVSKETGVPVEVLSRMSAESEDDLMEAAREIGRYFETSASPVVPTDGVQPPAKSGGMTADDWLRSTIRNR